MGFLGDVLQSLGLLEIKRRGAEERETERYSEILTFDLSTERNNERIEVPGDWDYLGVLAYNGTSTGCTFRINAPSAPSLQPDRISSLVYGSGINVLYLTNTAQTGKTLQIQLGGALIAEMHPITRKTSIMDSTGAVIDPRQNMGTGVYVGQYIASDDLAHQIVATSTEVREATIYNSSANDAYIGNSTSQTFPLPAAASLSMYDVDLSNIYAINQTAGNNIQLEIIGSTV